MSTGFGILLLMSLMVSTYRAQQAPPSTPSSTPAEHSSQDPYPKQEKCKDVSARKLFGAGSSVSIN